MTKFQPNPSQLTGHCSLGKSCCLAGSACPFFAAQMGTFSVSVELERTAPKRLFKRLVKLWETSCCCWWLVFERYSGSCGRYMKIPMRLSSFVGSLSLRMQKHYLGAMLLKIIWSQWDDTFSPTLSGEGASRLSWEMLSWSKLFSEVQSNDKKKFTLCFGCWVFTQGFFWVSIGSME